MFLYYRWFVLQDFVHKLEYFSCFEDCRLRDNFTYWHCLYKHTFLLMTEDQDWLYIVSIQKGLITVFFVLFLHSLICLSDTVSYSLGGCFTKGLICKAFFCLEALSCLRATISELSSRNKNSNELLSSAIRLFIIFSLKLFCYTGNICCFELSMTVNLSSWSRFDYAVLLSQRFM